MADTTDPTQDGWKARSHPGFFELVGPLWAKQEADAWTYAIVAEPRHTNSAGVVHGGMLATLLDHALAAIAWEAIERKPLATISLDVQFLAPARPGDFVVARGRIVRKTSSLVFMHGSLTVNGAEVAVANGIWKRF